VSTVTAGQQITAGLNEIVEMSFSVSNWTIKLKI
jgi:hypothetical protein